MTLVELMVSIVIGMLMVAALAVLIADQSTTRAEVDKAGRMIENGRFAVQVIASDLQLAGFWGELSTVLAAPAAIPDPCSVTASDVDAALGMHVQGYSAVTPTSAPATVPSCISNYKLGTDIVVVRRLEPDSSSLETGGVPDFNKLTDGRLYMQTGLVAGGTSFTHVLASANSATNTATFALVKKNGTTRATVRMVVTHIYYVSTCSVVSGTTCQDSIPTLKRVERGQVSTTTTLAEGIEDLQIDYGQDTDGNGSPDAYVSGAALTSTTWPDVMTAKIHVLARTGDPVAGYTDKKTYEMGTATGAAAAANAPYKRHVMVQTVRIMNPSVRRLQ